MQLKHELKVLTCLLYFPLRLASNSAKPCMSRSAAAVIGLSWSERVKSEVQPEKISGGTEVSLQQQIHWMCKMVFRTVI